LAIIIASGPDKRITPIAPVPDGVAKATMVSSVFVITGKGRKLVASMLN
jgi:hypothetical protein